MAWTMPEIAVQRLIQYGIVHLRQNKDAFKDIFGYQIHHPIMSRAYGDAYVERIWTWFNTEKIRTVHSWILSAETVPCFSIHLASDSEDETKAAISDYYGNDDEECEEVSVSWNSITVDIGIHASKTSDQVLWMYYIVSYILFKYKPLAQSMGIELHTYSATDWQKEASKMPDNIWTRWIRLRCTVSNTWSGKPFDGPFDIETLMTYERLKDE